MKQTIIHVGFNVEVRSLRSYQDRGEIVRFQLILFFGLMVLDEIKPEHVEAYCLQRRSRNGGAPSLLTCPR